MSNLKNDDTEELKEINKRLKIYKPYYNMYKKLLVIKSVKEGMTRGDAADLVNVHRKTAENWVKLYNMNGLDGLEPNYSNCGQTCRLTDDQLTEIKNIILESPEQYDVESIKKLIKEQYNVEYSHKQTWQILTKKLNLIIKSKKLISP